MPARFAAKDRPGRELLRALAAAPGDSPARVRGHNALAQLLGQQSDYAQAQYHLAQAQAQALNDQAGLGETLRLAAWAANDNHNPAQAIALFHEALAIFQALGDRLHVADIWSSLAHFTVLTPEEDRSQTHRWLEDWQEAYQQFVALGSREAIAITQHHLGQVARRREQWEQATALYSESLAVHQNAGDEGMIARCLAGLGGVALGRGEAEEARRLLGAAKAIFDRLPPFLLPADRAEFAELCSIL